MLDLIKQKGSNGIPKTPLYMGKGGGSPHINTRMKKLSVVYNNVWLALRFQIGLLVKKNYYDPWQMLEPFVLYAN